MCVALVAVQVPVYQAVTLEQWPPDSGILTKGLKNRASATPI